MEFLNIKVPENCVIRLTSDWQIGASGSSKNVIDRILEPVRKNKNYRLALLGDLIDAIRHNDRRFSWDDVDDEVKKPDEQMERVIELLTPVKEKIICLGAGNHEFALRDTLDPTKLMAKMLGVPYGGYSALVSLNGGKTKLYLWHGRPSIRSTLVDPLQRQLTLKRRLVSTNKNRWADCDLIAQGHTNQLIIVRPGETKELKLRYDEKTGDVASSYEESDKRWYVNCGSAQRLFVKGKTTYAEAFGFLPLPLGCVDVFIENGKIVDVREVILG